MNKHLHLFDGTWIFFRALFSIPETFQDEEGKAVNGVYGFTAFMLKYMHEYNLKHAAIAFDESLHTCFRLAIFPEYKANREPADENIRFQLQTCKEICELLGLEVFAHKKFEADDLIASIAKQSRKKVRIISKDKDLQQLIANRIHVYDPGNDKVRDLKWFVENYDFQPKHFTAYQALVGDSVDNVPGVTGIGAKTAQKLVSRYGSLKQVAESVRRWERDGFGLPVNGRVATNLVVERERMFLMQTIVELKTDIVIKDRRGFAVSPVSNSRIKNAFTRLRFFPALTRSVARFGKMYKLEL